MKSFRRQRRGCLAMLLPLLLVLCLTLSSCGSAGTSESASTVVSAGTSLASKAQNQINAATEVESGTPTAEEPSLIKSVRVRSSDTFDPGVIPDYSGEPYTAINNNVPYFSESDLTTDSYESYSELDSLGRCGAAVACVGQDLMPTEERGSIGSVKPTGWHTVKYSSVDGNYLYNRCHLIAYMLSGENANEQNLITGTRYLNIEGMLPFENMVADYVEETGNHVLYRSTPVFDGDNLVADGVLLEAMSVEDAGESILFNVYCYNVQPGIAIDYATGDSWEDDGVSANQAATTDTTQANTTDSEVPTEDMTEAQETETQSIGTVSAETDSPASEEITYILNTNTKKFHLPSCSSVDQMNSANKMEYTGTRQDIIDMGYNPCKRCNP